EPGRPPRAEGLGGLPRGQAAAVRANGGASRKRAGRRRRLLPAPGNPRRRRIGVEPMDVFKTDLRERADGYQRKRYTPSEVLERYLANATAHDKKLKAFLDVRADDARVRAKELDGRIGDAAKLPLYGIPVAVKDNFLVRGWKTTAGSKILENYLSPYT